MNEQERSFLVDVGLSNLPFPIKVPSRTSPDDQATTANVSITARVMQQFQPHWIDRFIQVLHRHRDNVGPRSLRANLQDYIDELKATTVKIDFEYPVFVEKLTPVSRERCLVCYRCAFSARGSSLLQPRCLFRIEVPVITTYPAGTGEAPESLFGQLSTVTVEVQSDDVVYPEDLVALVDRHALAPMYSFLTEEDQRQLIGHIHSQRKTSAAMIGEIKDELTRAPGISWYSVRCTDFGMLHSYTTMSAVEKSIWVPDTTLEDERDTQLRLK